MQFAGIKLQFSGQEIRDMFLARATEHETEGKKEREELRSNLEKYPQPFGRQATMTSEMVESQMKMLENQEKDMVAQLRLYADHVVVDATYTLTSLDLLQNGLLPRLPRVLSYPFRGAGVVGGGLSAFEQAGIYSNAGAIYPGLG